MSARDPSLIYPVPRMMLAQQRVADLRRAAAPKPPRRPPRREGAQRVGCSYRLADGSWVHGRHSS